MSTVIFWFRHDLRLDDQPALHAACQAGTRHLLPVYCLPDLGERSPWGFARMGNHRRAWLASALDGLRQQLARTPCPLMVCVGPPTRVIPLLAKATGAARVVCEEVCAPFEQAEVASLRAQGLHVQTVWQSSLLNPDSLPFHVQDLPDSFTPFRQAVEQARISPIAPLPPPNALPPWPPGFCAIPALTGSIDQLSTGLYQVRADATFPFGHDGMAGDELSGRRHLSQYLARRLPDSYKQTRDALTGVNNSSKWSAWLATGALSARRIMAELRSYEDAHGATDGSYWLWFELLWRDYFRLLHMKHGIKLYRAGGLGSRPAPTHDAAGFERWCNASTGDALVDAAMHELSATGYISNRLRQVVASYLVHELGGDWRAGVAWFESQLIDHDVYSNQGNWLYIAGRGTDPRGGRRFDTIKQATLHDPDGSYRRQWSRTATDQQE